MFKCDKCGRIKILESATKVSSERFYRWSPTLSLCSACNQKHEFEIRQERLEKEDRIILEKEVEIDKLMKGVRFDREGYKVFNGTALVNTLKEDLIDNDELKDFDQRVNNKLEAINKIRSLIYSAIEANDGINKDFKVMFNFGKKKYIANIIIIEVPILSAAYNGPRVKPGEQMRFKIYQI